MTILSQDSSIKLDVKDILKAVVNKDLNVWVSITIGSLSVDYVTMEL